MKKNAALKAALIGAMLVTILTGCGGAPSAEEISKTALQPAQQTTQTQTSATAPVVTPLQLPTVFKTDKTTPKFMVEALEKQMPIVIFIYKENDPLSERVKENLKLALQKIDSNKVIFIALNSEKPEHVFGMFKPLGVTSVPFVAIIDSKGVIVKEFAGYVDDKTLTQAIYDVTGGIVNTEETTSTTETM